MAATPSCSAVRRASPYPPSGESDCGKWKGCGEVPFLSALEDSASPCPSVNGTQATVGHCARTGRVVSSRRMDEGCVCRAPDEHGAAGERQGRDGHAARGRAGRHALAALRRPGLPCARLQVQSAPAASGTRVRLAPEYTPCWLQLHVVVFSLAKSADALSPVPRSKPLVPTFRPRFRVPRRKLRAHGRWAIAEPQASVAPRLSDNKVGSKREVVRAAATVSLLCAAQASPPPFFRSVRQSHPTRKIRVACKD